MSFVQIAPSSSKPANSVARSVHTSASRGRLYNPGDFITIATNIRTKLRELCPRSKRFPRHGEDKELDRRIKTYLMFNFDSKNDLRMHERVARLSERCWDKLLEVGPSLTHSKRISSYSVNWINASMPEEQIYATLCELKDGKKKFKDLKVKGNSKSNHNQEKNESDESPLPSDTKEVAELKKNLCSLAQTSDREIDSLKRKLRDEQEASKTLRHKLSEALNKVNWLKGYLDDTNRRHADEIAKYITENNELKEELRSLKDTTSVDCEQENHIDEFSEVLSPEFKTPCW